MMEIVISRLFHHFRTSALALQKYIIPEMSEDIVGGHPRSKMKIAMGCIGRI
jgi:hypothetical protein